MENTGFKLHFFFAIILSICCTQALQASINNCDAWVSDARIPLDAVCPSCINDGFVINTPGSYYLTRDLISNTSGAKAISIFSDNVSIDLNGFTISNTSGSTISSEIGISISSYDNILIKNGIIKGFGGYGIRAVFSDHCTLIDLIISDNLIDGATIDDFCTIDNVVFSNNGGDGLEVDDGAQIKNCIAEGNALNGFNLGERCQLFNCSAIGNTTSGIKGSIHNLADGCIATANQGTGITLSTGSVVRNCMSTNNEKYGISVFNGTVSNCNASDNGDCVLNGACTPSLGGSSSVIICPEGTGICGNGRSLIYNNHSNNNMIGIFLTSEDGATFKNYCESNSHQGIVGVPRAVNGSISGAMHFRNVCHNNGVSPRSNLTILGIPAGEFYYSGTDISYGPLIDINGVGNLIGTTNADHPLANFEF